MTINGFLISGISNIENLSLDVIGMNALVAPNGYGKSNVLNAISFGIQFIMAREDERRQMLSSRFAPINIMMPKANFQYGYECAWASDEVSGRILSEWCRIKSDKEQRFHQLINRSNTENCLIVPSPRGRCNKQFEVNELQLAITMIANGGLFLSNMAKQVSSIVIPNLETLNNPESYFSVDRGTGIPLLGGQTLSEYIFRLKAMDEYSYSILVDGLKQLIPRIDEFEPTEITLGDGTSKVYDIRIREAFNSNAWCFYLHFASRRRSRIFR